MRGSKGFRVPTSPCNASSHGLERCSPLASSIQTAGREHLVNLLKAAGEQVYQLRDFALLLDGFPADAVDEEEIARFFCSAVLPNQPPESVVKVVIGFDARHYEEHVKLHESLKERLDILKTGISLIKLVEDWIMSVNGSAIQEALNNPTIWSCLFACTVIAELEMPVAFMVRLTITYTINTGLTYIIVLQDPRWWYVRGGLIECVAMQLFSFLLSEIALSLLQWPWLMRVMRRDCLLPMFKKPISQADFNRLQEGPDFCTPTKYAAMMQGFCSLSLYVIIAPFLSLQAICTWVLLYWIYKGALLRLAKRPNPEMTAVVNQAILVLRASVLLLAAGSFLLRPTTTGSAVQTLHICGFSAGVVALFSVLLPRWLQLKLTYLCATGASPATWQTVHYYKLQHVFFVHYHTSNPVYASWGPERNPAILQEPGVNSCSPAATAKAFAARGAAKRARRRMAAFKTGTFETSSACRIPKADGVNPSTIASDFIDHSEATEGSSNNSSDTEGPSADELVPNAATMRRLRATLVEGRAAPEFQRLFIESQAKGKSKFQSKASTSTSQPTAKYPLGREKNSRSQESLSSGDTVLQNATTEYDDPGESESPSTFFSWLRSLVLKHLYFHNTTVTNDLIIQKEVATSLTKTHVFSFKFRVTLLKKAPKPGRVSPLHVKSIKNIFTHQL
ncbi:GTP-binding protein TypA, related, related [Eimeria praecox]|uniref:GTP-binding protein TypA, related, related n=1 Tax=Eimeria praecox TaxID=51316 RepID=U6GQA7_9EIME|nr:GTP-binding protein TypA, related, related [Eimeria praecox]